MFMVNLTHTPEMCLSRDEFKDEFRTWFEGMDDRAKRLNVRIHEVYSCPTEHAFYFILEAGDYREITAFFAGIMLTNHAGRVFPVVTLKEATDILIK